jgi:hypothetical protein
MRAAAEVVRLSGPQLLVGYNMGDGRFTGSHLVNPEAFLNAAIPGDMSDTRRG